MRGSGLSFAADPFFAATPHLNVDAQISRQVDKARILVPLYGTMSFARRKVGNGIRYVGVLGLFLSIAFAGTAVGQPAPTSDIKSERFSTDTPLTTASGATFTAPSGWSVSSSTNKRVLDPPEADSHLALVDVQAADAAAAVAAGWASYRPDANRPLRIALPQAPLNGWDERQVYNYETSPNEKAVVYALAWRAGQDWTVAIVEATLSTFEKRNAAFSLALGSLSTRTSPKGWTTG